jgi:hypothetical protein
LQHIEEVGRIGFVGMEVGVGRVDGIVVGKVVRVVVGFKVGKPEGS